MIDSIDRAGPVAGREEAGAARLAATATSQIVNCRTDAPPNYHFWREPDEYSATRSKCPFGIIANAERRATVSAAPISTASLQEGASWGKVNTGIEQMVFAEAGSVLPLLASDAWHRGHWKNREQRRWAKLFED